MLTHRITWPKALLAGMVAMQISGCSDPQPMAIIESNNESLLQFDNGKLIQFKENRVRSIAIFPVIYPR